MSMWPAPATPANPSAMRSTFAARKPSGLLRGHALPGEMVVGHHGAAGDEAHLLLSLVHGHSGPHDALVRKFHGQDAPGQGGDIAEVPSRTLNNVFPPGLGKNSNRR